MLHLVTGLPLIEALNEQGAELIRVFFLFSPATYLFVHQMVRSFLCVPSLTLVVTDRSLFGYETIAVVRHAALIDYDYFHFRFTAVICK